MQYVFDSLLSRYGTQITWKSSVIRGFFQSVNSRSWQNMERMYGPLGEIPRGQYICMLPAAVAVTPGDVLGVGQGQYQIQRVEDVRLGDRVLYQWCLCVRKGGEDLW